MKAGWWILAGIVIVGAAIGVGLALRAPKTDEVVFVRDAPEISAMVPAPDGGLLYAERRTGVVRKVDAKGRQRPSPGKVPVSSDGERGLLGLALDADGTLYASWTDRQHVLVVGEVSSSLRIVWKGPKMPARRLGGRIAFAPDKKILVGIGDLGADDKIDVKAEPNGKIYELDPAGPDTQTPMLLSSGWHNPMFVVTAGHQLWVADNRAGAQRDRLAQVSQQGQPAFSTQLPPHFDPSAIVAPATKTNQLYVCGSGTRQLVRYTIQQQGFAAPDEGDIAKDCSHGLAILKDGRLVYGTDEQIRIA
jgi:hypothetical protein